MCVHVHACVCMCVHVWCGSVVWCVVWCGVVCVVCVFGRVGGSVCLCVVGTGGYGWIRVYVGVHVCVYESLP